MSKMTALAIAVGLMLSAGSAFAEHRAPPRDTNPVADSTRWHAPMENWTPESGPAGPVAPDARGGA